MNEPITGTVPAEPKIAATSENFVPDASDFNAALAADRAIRDGKQPLSASEPEPAPEGAEPPKQEKPPVSGEEPPKEHDEIPEPEFKSKKAADTWRKSKEVHARQLAEEKTKATALEKRINELNEKLSGYNSQTDYDAIKKERDEFSEQLRILAVERHPTFKDRFDKRITAAKDAAKSIVGTDHASRLDFILSMPEGDLKLQAMEELTGEIGAARSSQLGAALYELTKVQAERSQELAKGPELYNQLVADEERQQQARQTAVKQTFQHVLAQVQDPKTGMVLFQKVEGNAEQNAEVDALVNNAQAIFTGQMPLEDAARASMWAASAPALLKTMRSQNDKITALEAELAELRAAKPGMEETGGDEIPPDDAEDSKYTVDDYAKGAAMRAQKAGIFQRR